MKSFKVCYAKDVDIPRIISEAPVGTEAILVVSANAALLLSTAFLATFKAEDSLVLGPESLYPHWGSGSLSALDVKNAVVFCHSSTGLIRGYRAVILDKERIAPVMIELHAARAFVPSRKVCVSYP